MDSQNVQVLGGFQADIPERSRANIATPQREVSTQPAVVAPRRQLTPAEVDILRPVIERLYVGERQTFKQVQKYLRTHHNFTPTERQFSRLRAKWGIRKNTRTSERESLLKTLEESGISEEGNIGAVSLNLEKIKRWKRESKHAGYEDYNSSRTSQATNNQLSRRVGQAGPRHQPISQEFYMMEGLMHSINAYVAGMYDQRAWIPSGSSLHQTATPGSQDEAYNVLDKFYAGCWAAFELMQAKRYVEARKLLSGACSFLRSIIISAHPETLIWFFGILYDLSQGMFGPLDGVLDLLREHIGGISMVILPEKHPFRAICCSLAKTDRKELSHTLFMSLKSLTEVFEVKGGRFNATSIMGRLTYTRWAYRNDFAGKERVLRKLRSDIQTAVFADRDALFNVMESLGGSLRDQNRLGEYEEIARDYVIAARGRPESNKAKNHLAVGLTMMAKAQHMQEKYDAAEISLREAVNLFLARPADLNLTWGIHTMSVLEIWLRGWSRTSDADKLKEEINILVERDSKGKEDVY